MKRIFYLLLSFIICSFCIAYRPNNVNAELYEGVIYWAPNTGGTLFFDLSEQFTGIERVSSSGFSGSWPNAGGVHFNKLYKLFGYGLDVSYNSASQYIAPVTTENSEAPVTTTYTSREAFPVIVYDQSIYQKMGSTLLTGNAMRVDLTAPEAAGYSNISNNMFSGNETYVVKQSVFAPKAFSSPTGNNQLSLGYAVTKQNVLYTGGNFLLNHNIAKRVALGGKFSAGFAFLNTGLTEIVATVSPFSKTTIVGNSDTDYDPSKTIVVKNGETRIRTIHLASKLGAYSTFAISDAIALLGGVDFFKVFDRTYSGKVPKISDANVGFDSNGTMSIGRSVILFNFGMKILL